jgi:hypothetical protein
MPDREVPFTACRYLFNTAVASWLKAACLVGKGWPLAL